MLHSESERNFPRLSGFIEWVVFYGMRRKVRHDYAERQTKREEAFEQIEKNRENAERLGFRSAAGIYNAAMFVLLLDQDLQDYVLQMIHAEVDRVFRVRT